MGTTIVDIGMELKMKISRIKYLESILVIMNCRNQMEILVIRLTIMF